MIRHLTLPGSGEVLSHGLNLFFDQYRLSLSEMPYIHLEHMYTCVYIHLYFSKNINVYIHLCIYTVIFFLKIFMHESVPTSIIQKINSRNPVHS